MIADAEYLYSLPEPVQAELVELVRLGAGMSQDEKEVVLTLLVNYAESAIRHALFQEQMTLVQLLNPVGQLLGALNDCNSPETNGKVA
ncbi:hypothetical protein ACOACQ_17665 [Nocardioides sp. CPCC 206347]|uniref:hypothetical protein n=1 Tax=unclassified Nocardioides TaxID=2615069 RepID=UPI003612E546